MGCGIDWFKVVRVDPTLTETVIVPKLYLEQATIMVELLQQRFETDTRISMALGETSEGEGNNLIENTFYKLRKL